MLAIFAFNYRHHVIFALKIISMKHLTLFSPLLLIFVFSSCSNREITTEKETVTISGKVTDFNGRPIDSSAVQIRGAGFDNLYEVFTDQNGDYSVEVEKGNYMALMAMRLKEYPRMDAVPEEDMRLEYWGWNIIADRDLTINPRYDRLELYGTTVFRNYGGYPGFFIYFRPMSLHKYLSSSKEIYLDKSKAEKTTDISVKPDHLQVRVYADDEPLKINSIRSVEEFGGEGVQSITGYLVQVDAPKNKSDKPYIIFRVEAENTEYSEKGENIYFFEKKDFR